AFLETGTRYEKTACSIDCLGVRGHRVRTGAKSRTGGPEGSDRCRDAQGRAGNTGEGRHESRDQGREEGQRREKSQSQRQGQGESRRSQEVSFTHPSSPAQAGLFL